MSMDWNAIGRLWNPDLKRIEQAKKRQAAVWRGERPDHWPIILGGPLSPAQQAIPDANYQEAFEDDERMLCVQLRGACGITNGNCDAVPSARGNYGTGVLLSCFGLEQRVFTDKMPWLLQHLTREQVAALNPDDIRPAGTFARGLDYMRWHRKMMGDRLPLYCMDTQGPFDLAHLALGDDLFYALYDDPPLVHHLMECCLSLSIKTHEWMKEIAGEPRMMLYHSGTLYAENMGIRVCEATTAILGPDNIETFTMPYTRRLVSHFGGAWAHYCGRNDALTHALLAIPEIRGTNFGHIPGHEADHGFEQAMAWCRERRKVYFGSWPRFPGETGCDYLKRLHGWATQGFLIPHAYPAIGEDLPEPRQVLDFWYGL